LMTDSYSASIEALVKRDLVAMERLNKSSSLITNQSTFMPVISKFKAPKIQLIS